MYVARVPNRGSPPAVLLRENYREAGKVKSRTLANLSHWPPEKLAAFEAGLRGLPPGGGWGELAEAFEVVRSLPHGHVAAALGTAQLLGLPELLDAGPSRLRDLAIALVVARVVGPAPKLATARGLRQETASSSLGQVLGLSRADEDDLYGAMDWVLGRQAAVEEALAKRHLSEGTLVLYDVSSAAFEGKCCPIAQLGYARDGVKGRLQVVYGLLTNKDGVPVAVEVFEGSTGGPGTVANQVEKLKERFRLSHVVFVGDRGMLTMARVEGDLAPAGLGWVTALRAPTIRSLAEGGYLQLSIFDQADMAEISHPGFPGERLVLCRNPALAAERARKRDDLLAATEAALAKVKAAVERERGPYRGEAKIAMRVARDAWKYKMGKHFRLSISDDSFSYERDEASVAAEKALDGIYVVRANVAAEQLSAAEVVSSYKRLANVERAFRIFNGDLDVRPIHHRNTDRVKAHFFLCMLAHYLEWHMTDRLAPLLFVDEDKQAAEAARKSPVAPAQRSRAGQAKDRSKRDAQGQPVHSFATLLDDLATLCLNRIQPTDPRVPAFDKLTVPTPLQRRAFELLGVSPRLGAA